MRRLGFILRGWLLFWVAKVIEKFGDGASGASAALLHLAALALIVVAGAMFLWALRGMVAGDPPAAAGHDPQDPDEPFDPGAAIARHLARKAEEQPEAGPPLPEPMLRPGGFGRRRLPQTPV